MALLFLLRDSSFLLGLLFEMNLFLFRYIIILDPAISGNETTGTYLPYERGVEDGVFITTQDGSDIAWGKVWPEYPNITVNESQDLAYQVEVGDIFFHFNGHFCLEEFLS